MRLPMIDPQWIATAQALLPGVITQARMFLGWSSIVVGILGTVLPVIPGLPFLILGSHLLGHRDRRLRWARVHSKLVLRQLAGSRQPWLRFPARLAWQGQVQTRRKLRDLRWKKRRSL